MRRIDPKKKAAIVAKMRSSKQCVHRLRKEDAFCALGCICDVSGVGAWRYEVKEDVWSYDSAAVVAPLAVREWLGIGTQYPTLTFEGTSYEVDELNDGNGAPRLSLNEIADLIEEQW